MTDQNGKTEYIPLYAPDKQLSLTQDNDARPYETYNIEVRLNGFDMQQIIGIQIFAGVRSYQPIGMIPDSSSISSTPDRHVSFIPDHHLLTNAGGNNEGQTPPDPGTPSKASRILPQVIIPTNITVHLGRPDRSAENVTVPFIYYLKNVASSEIYPTWPYEALKANIWAQISLVLNRVFTEWYPSQGYNFNITNSTAFDQAFVKNRNIYENMAAIVDEVFNEYIQKRNFQEPFYAEYCDGKIAQCPGMKQWGTLDLANRGYTALNILKYYYGDTIRIVSSDNIQDITASYPGTPLRIGSTGEIVAMLQGQLNAIAINYPNITPIFPVNGVFGASTDAAVRVFQRQFNLTVDGIVGKSTYYKISFVYTAVRKLAELGSLGQIENLYSGAWPQVTLREGDRGVEVQLMQYYLSSISLVYPQVPPVSIDGRFGPTTERAVLAFQKAFGLIQDGIVGQATWDSIYAVYETVADTIVPGSIPPYPGRPVRQGDTGENVVLIQNALNTVSTQYPTIPILVSDGNFGTSTRNAIIAFQELFGLVPDGVVGQLTWNELFTTAYEIENGDTRSVSAAPYPGTPLREGVTGDPVTLMQNRLKTIAIYYKAVPDISVDGTFASPMRNAVIAFQNLLGLPADGVIDQRTWDKINETYEELIG